MSENEQEMPEVAPGHSDVRTEFNPVGLGVVVGLGLVAITVGSIFGLVLAG